MAEQDPGSTPSRLELNQIFLPIAKIMDPRLQIGLYNPDPRVRKAVVEALGKQYGDMCMKMAEKATRDAEARTARLRAAEAHRVFTLRAWDSEEQAAYGDWVKDDEDENGEQEVTVAKEVEEKKEDRPADVVAVAAAAAAGETGVQKPAEKQQEKVCNNQSLPSPNPPHSKSHR